jgi:hypothetical protein
VTGSKVDTGRVDGTDRPRTARVVRRALRALADGTAPRNRESCAYRSVIDEAVGALDRVTDAASVVGDAGRLRRAVDAAERRGDEATAARGRRVLADVERYRRAAAGGDLIDDAGDRGDAAASRLCGSDGEGDRGRGTVLPGDGQALDR